MSALASLPLWVIVEAAAAFWLLLILCVVSWGEFILKMLIAFPAAIIAVVLAVRLYGWFMGWPV
jgi:hypothetical protein